jgi:hypothetical protein
MPSAARVVFTVRAIAGATILYVAAKVLPPPMSRDLTSALRAATEKAAAGRRAAEEGRAAAAEAAAEARRP